MVGPPAQLYKNEEENLFLVAIIRKVVKEWHKMAGDEKEPWEMQLLINLQYKLWQFDSDESFGMSKATAKDCSKLCQEDERLKKEISSISALYRYHFEDLEQN